MKSILVFGGSTSRNSINKTLASYAAMQLDQMSHDIIDLNDFEMPVFSVDREKESGIPQKAQLFKEKIVNADGIIMSLSEHNGSYSAAYKNIYDWVSRIEGNMWEDKPILLLATSPGARGGQSVLEAAKTRLPFQGGNVISSFSLPSFNKNFSPSEGIVDPELSQQFFSHLKHFETSL